VTPVGDIELELEFRVAVRGRMRDLAELMRALGDAQTVLLWAVEKAPATERDAGASLIESKVSIEP
jgi:hypothetical protein